ncbi:MAG: TldD/PmbA family protein [Candidatus Heimdallarchaeota archaeon]
MALFSYGSNAIEKALKKEADYVDVRIENSFENFLGLRNSAIYRVNTNLQESIGIRVLFNGAWGFASSSSLDNSSIKKMVESAVTSAKKAAKMYPDKKVKLADVSTRKTSVEDECEKHPQYLEQKDRIELINYISKRILARTKETNILDLKLAEDQKQKVFINSENSEIEQILVRTSLFLGCSIQSSSNFQRARTVAFGGVGGIEQFSKLEFDDFLNHFIKTIPGIAQAKLIKPGEQPVILNEEMGWTLCHEFCHAVESDIILEGQSPLASKIGSKMGSEEVTIIDDASFNGYGEYYFDDEGVKASGTLIIEDGILFDVLQSRETAGEMDAVPTSNGRAESCLHYPQVRQSNTFFEPGNHSFNDLLDHTKTGLYICDSFGGVSDTAHGSFQLDPQYGRKIEKGQLGDYVTGFSLVGNLFTILGDVNGMSKDIKSYPAICGKKGQRVSVGSISPKVSLKRANIISNLPQRQVRRIDFSRLREI